MGQPLRRRQGAHHRQRPVRRPLPLRAARRPASRSTRRRSRRSPPRSAPSTACSGPSMRSDVGGQRLRERKITSGLYRITDSDGDDQLDKVELLRVDEGARRSRRPCACCSRRTASRSSSSPATAPRRPSSTARACRTIWGEDHLLPRMPDGRGFMRDVLAPGGIIYRVSPDGKDFEVCSSGFRNIFDAAFNQAGELFTYDADMEYDFNTPWYRPTRICHVRERQRIRLAQRRGQAARVVSRQPAAGPEHRPRFADRHDLRLRREVPGEVSERPVLPRLELGQALRDPPRARRARPITATKEEFLSGAPLPLTDVIIHPADGAMYFAIGGRKVQCGPLPRDLRRQRDRPRRCSPTPTGGRSTRAAASARGVSRQGRRRRARRGRGRTSATPIASSAGPRAPRSSTSRRRPGRTRRSTENDPGEAARGAARARARAPASIRSIASRPIRRSTRAMRGKLLDALLQKLDWDALNQEQRITPRPHAMRSPSTASAVPTTPRCKQLLAQLDPRFPAADLRAELGALRDAGLSPVAHRRRQGGSP